MTNSVHEAPGAGALDVTYGVLPEWPSRTRADAHWVGVLVRFWFRRQDRGTMSGVTQHEVRWSEVRNFVLVAFALSWTAWIGLKPIFPGLAVRTFVAMFGPMFAAIFVIRRRRPRRLRQVRRMNWHWFLSGTLASLLAISVIGLLVGAGYWLSLFAHVLRPGGSSGQDLFEVLPLPPALVIYWMTAFGEEYGWRGFLLTTLSPLGGAAPP